MSLACLALFSFLTSFVKEKNLYKFETIASIAIVIVYYCYIFLISNNTLLSYLYSIGINSMGRFQMWAYVGQFLEFSPSYFGHGYSFSTLMLEKKHIWTYNGAVFGLHGGILGFYTDMGFIMFGLWMIFNLIVIPKHFRKKYGFQVTNLYWALTVYLFILYITESTINHFITQSLYMIILLHAINLNEMKKN